MDSLFGHLFGSPPSASCKIDSHSNGVHSKSASDLYLRILACGITISALNDTAASGINDTENNLSSQVLPILMATATEILAQDQRKLVIIWFDVYEIGEIPPHFCRIRKIAHYGNNFSYYLDP